MSDQSEQWNGVQAGCVKVVFQYVKLHDLAGKKYIYLSGKTNEETTN